VGVNRDASLFRRAPGSGLVARHAAAAPPGRSGSAVRRIEVTAAGPDRRSLRHSKSGRGRSSCRSPPACDSLRRGTAAPTPPRHGMAEHQVDLRHGCRDIGPACVPSTVWGHGVEPNRQVQISASCLPLKSGKSYPPAPSRPARSVPDGCQDDGTLIAEKGDYATAGRRASACAGQSRRAV
jgi:hypothetical protein